MYMKKIPIEGMVDIDQLGGQGFSPPEDTSDGG